MLCLLLRWMEGVLKAVINEYRLSYREAMVAVNDIIPEDNRLPPLRLIRAMWIYLVIHPLICLRVYTMSLQICYIEPPVDLEELAIGCWGFAKPIYLYRFYAVLHPMLVFVIRNIITPATMLMLDLYELFIVDPEGAADIVFIFMDDWIMHVDNLWENCLAEYVFVLLALF
ncbi:hypothetical protein F4778DRAFT_609181 [Xylariomycetidae sp. FL2044]|nr:hypothetical protein F4778DRAFT_609181 [Xylariomycetidae sp. FL2044]